MDNPPPEIDPHWVYRPLLDLIGKTEGTAPPKGRGYNETLGYGAYTGGPVDLIHMTIGEVDQLQSRMLRHPANRWNSSAVGWYQIVQKTRRRVDKALKFSPSRPFNADTQDRMGRYLLWYRGIDKYTAGTKSEDAMLTSLAQEWASIPKPDGRGYYGNQARTPVGPTEVRLALREVRHRANQERTL